MARQQAVPEPLGRRFAHLFAFTGLSNLADGVVQVGVPLLALTLTRSPAQISLLTAAATLPWLLLSMHAGLLVDRHDRVRILIAATSVRLVVLVTGALAAATGRLTVPVLLCLLVAFGSAEVFADSSASVLVPAVVHRNRLGAANSRLLGVQQAANAFVGGPLAGLVLGLGAGWVFGLPAGLCVLGLVLVVRGLLGRVPAVAAGATVQGATAPGTAPAGTVPAGTVPARTAPRRRPTLRADAFEGLHFLWGHRVIRPLLLTGTVLNFTSAGYFAVFVLWVVGPDSRVGLDPALYGVLLAALAVGAVLGAVAAERLLRRFPEARLITGSWLANTLLLLVPVLVPNGWAIGACCAVLGFTNMIGNVVNQSMRQRLVPERLLGRVGGVSRTISYGSMPLGALLGGVVGESFGLPAVFLGAVGLSLAFVLWVLREVPQTRIDEADRALEPVAVG